MSGRRSAHHRSAEGRRRHLACQGSHALHGATVARVSRPQYAEPAMAGEAQLPTNPLLGGAPLFMREAQLQGVGPMLVKITAATALALLPFAVPIAADAQQAAKVHRLAILGSTRPPPNQVVWEPLVMGLRDRGYAESSSSNGSASSPSRARTGCRPCTFSGGPSTREVSSPAPLTCQ